jgi:hypothetical protein
MADVRNQSGEGGTMKLKAPISAPLYNILRDSAISGDMRVLERDKTLTPDPDGKGIPER